VRLEGIGDIDEDCDSVKLNGEEVVEVNLVIE
jgi:hypothetical protein